MDWVDKPQNYKDLYGTLKLLRGSHLNNFPLKTIELGWVAGGSKTQVTGHCFTNTGTTLKLP